MALMAADEGEFVKNRAGLLPVWLSCWALLFSVQAAATIDAYEFNNMEEESRFRVMVAELRCPKCQNQNIADSNAGLAKDIKDRVHKLIQEGKSNSEITDYMVERYGDFITYRPPLNPTTWFLWFGPLIIAVLVGVGLLLRKLRSDAQSDPTITTAQEQKVKDLMQKLEQSDQ